MLYCFQKDGERTKKSLDELFQEKQVNSDISRLKQAIANQENFEGILQDYRQQFSNKQMRIIDQIVNSDIVRQIYQKNRQQYNPEEKSQIYSEEKRRIQLEGLFSRNTELKTDFTDLKTALLNNSDISKIMQYYNDQLRKRELTALLNLLQSSQLEDWKKKQVKKNGKRKQKLDELFQHPDFKHDYGDLKKNLLQKKDYSELIKQYEYQLPKKQLKYLKELLESQRMKIFLQSQEDEKESQEKSEIFNQREKQIRKCFIQIKADVQQLIVALLNNKNSDQIMKQLQSSVSPKQYEEIEQILQSNYLQHLLQENKLEENESSSQIRQLRRNRYIRSDISELIKCLQSKSDTERVIQKLQKQIPQEQFMIIKKIMNIKDKSNLRIHSTQKLNRPVLIEKKRKLNNLKEQEMSVSNYQSRKSTIPPLSVSRNLAERQQRVQLLPIQVQRLKIINQKFSQAGLKLDFENKQAIQAISQLKRAIATGKQYNQILKNLRKILSSYSHQIIEKLLQETKFHIDLKKIQINGWRDKHSSIMAIIKGIGTQKSQLVDLILLNMNIQPLLKEIKQKQTPQNLMRFNKSIQSQQYHQFFAKYKLKEPFITKNHALRVQDGFQHFIAQGTSLHTIRKQYDFDENYYFFNLQGQIIAVQDKFNEPMEVRKCTIYECKFQGTNIQMILPYGINLEESKHIIQKNLDTKFQVSILIIENGKNVQKPADFNLQKCKSKKLFISYYVTLIIRLNQEQRDYQFKTLSHKSVLEVKEALFSMIRIKKQAQTWYIEGKEVLNGNQTLEGLGIKSQYFRIKIIELKSLEFYGFTKQIEIKRYQFKDFFIEDDKIFLQNIANSSFPGDEYSEIFRNQILGYIFASIKKHSLIKSSLNHIKSLIQSTGREQNLWKPPTSKQKCYFNQTFVLYYILRCSQKSLRIDILSSVISNYSVPLTYYDNKGNYVELIEQNYWIENKAFTVISFGFGEVMGKSELLNLIFETNFKNRDKMHKDCQGGIEVQYDIYKSEEYSVNLIDVSNDIEEDIKLKFAKECNLIIIQTTREEREVTTWMNQHKFQIPVILIYRDVEEAFQKHKKNYRAQLKKNNDNSMNQNIFQMIPYPFRDISFYNTHFNQVANGVQEFVRKIYEKSTPRGLYKFSDFLANSTDKQYKKFNQILKDIEDQKENLTQISTYFNEYKIIQSKINRGKEEEQNLRQMQKIKKKAISSGLANPLKKIVSFYTKNFTLSSQIMYKLRIFLTLLKNQLFREFNTLDQLLRDAQQKKEGADFQSSKLQIIQKMQSIKQLKKSLTTPLLKQQIDEFIFKNLQYKSPKDWEKIIKKIKIEIQFQIQPKAFSVQNFWRQVIYMSKFDPKYEFQLGNETILLMNSIVSLGKKEVQDSRNFELINGDLLEMPTQYLKKIFENQENKKVMVVSIFGPQSSGKSTLLNFVLGCDFMSSAGRCTKGIYGTYFEISNRQMANCDAILVLDTQGLFSNYENQKFSNRRGFDNKLVLFCLQVSDLIILNTKADVTKECQQILEAAYDSEVLDANLPQLYFVLNLNGGDINNVQSNQVQKFCDTIINTNPDAAEFISKNHAAGMPMAFNQIPRNSTAQIVTKYLKPKTLPSERFYKETKNLCYKLMDLITQRGRKRQGRTLQQVFVKMEQNWITINRYVILTKHGNKKTKLLEKDINLWKKDTKQHFINLLTDFEEELRVKKLSQLENWSQEKKKILDHQIQKAIGQFQSIFPKISGDVQRNAFIDKQSIDIQPNLNNSLQTLKKMTNQKKFEEQIRQSQNKGFDRMNFVLKSIKQQQAKSTTKISQQKKQSIFQDCWAFIEKQMRQKINRLSLAEESYKITLQKYNSQFLIQKKNRGTIQIPHTLFVQFYLLQIFTFKKKLRQNFAKKLGNQHVFQSSNRAPIMNIEKRQGDLTFKYLDMSKYFSNVSKPTFIIANIYELRQCIDWNMITRQIEEGLNKQNLHAKFINSLNNDFEILGVRFCKDKLKDFVESQLSNSFWNFSKKQLTTKDIYGFIVVQQQAFVQNPNHVAMKKLIPRKVYKNIFQHNCYYFSNSNQQMTEQQQKNKRNLISKFKCFSKIRGFQNQYSKLFFEQQRTFSNQQSQKIIALGIAKMAINDYKQFLKQNDANIMRKKLQAKILYELQLDLSRINLIIKCSDILDKSRITFAMTNNDGQFKNFEQFISTLENFSKYWINRKLSKSYTFKQQQQRLTNYEVKIGFYNKQQISLKPEYSQKTILKSYIIKEYDQFLMQIRRNNFTEFIQQELNYQNVFDAIAQFAVKQNLQKRDLNESIRMLKAHTDGLIDDINNDLKQVSQILRYDFIAQLHFFSCHFLWKLRQQYEWEKNQQIIRSFNEKKGVELQRFLKLASGSPHLQNRACAERTIQLYVHLLNEIIKKDRKKRQNDMKNAFKTTCTRDIVQLRIENQFEDQSIPKIERQNKIYKYLLTPVQYFRQKYEQYYAEQTKNLQNYKYLHLNKIIKDLLEPMVQFRDNTEAQDKCIADQIFQGNINQAKQNYFLPLFVEVLRKINLPYVDKDNQIGLKIKLGKYFKVDKIIMEKYNKDFLSILLGQDIMITNLKIFLNNMAEMLEQLIDNKNGICVAYTPEQINDFKLSITMNICNATCPCCKRNCDIDMELNSNHTKHQCDYGHQMRAIRGMRIESYEKNQIQYKASIQRCEDIDNYSQFNFNGQDYTWQEFQLEKKDEWDFKSNADELNYDKFAKFWKATGEKICQYYKNLDNLPMDFLEYNRQNINKLAKPPCRPTNFIFALDESYSMQGNPWDELVLAMKKNAGQIAIHNKNQNQFLSIFKFNANTTPVCQYVCPQIFNVSQITFGGGLTLFAPAFKLGIQIIQRNPCIDHVFVMITDGSSAYPQQEVQNMKKIQTKFSIKGRRVVYSSILIGNNDRVMEQIRSNLKGRHDNVTNAANVSSVFREILKSQQPLQKI